MDNGEIKKAKNPSLRIQERETRACSGGWWVARREDDSTISTCSPEAPVNKDNDQKVIFFMTRADISTSHKTFVIDCFKFYC